MDKYRAELGITSSGTPMAWSKGFVKLKPSAVNKNAQDCRKSQGTVDGPAHLLRPASAKILGYHHPRTGCQTRKETYQHIYDRRRCSDRRQRTGIHIISHHIGVYCIVELLEEISNQKRNGKQQDGSGDAPWIMSVLSFTFCAITFVSFVCIFIQL